MKVKLPSGAIAVYYPGLGYITYSTLYKDLIKVRKLNKGKK